MNRFGVVLGISIVSLAAAGCVPPDRIPQGSWAGQGTAFNYENITTEGQPAPQERDQSLTYETSLEISTIRVFERQALRLRIISKSGDLFTIPGKEVNIDGVLIPLKTMDDASVLYGVIETEKAESAKSDADLKNEIIAHGLSMRTDRGVILHLDYTNPSDSSGSISDTFHFLSDGVLKTGRYLSYSEDGDKDTLTRLWWVETLKPER